MGVGNATITATADNKSAVCELSVSSNKPEPPDAQKGNISGKLVDSNGNPLAGYTVTLHSNPITTTTDSNGVFVFENVPLTNHTLLIKSKDENEIGRYSLSFTQDDSTSFTTGEKQISIINTPNTVAIDVLINVSEDGNSTQIDNVTFKENPQTGEDSSMASIEWLAIIIGLVIISMSAVFRVKFKKD